MILFLTISLMDLWMIQSSSHSLMILIEMLSLLKRLLLQLREHRFTISFSRRKTNGPQKSEKGDLSSQVVRSREWQLQEPSSKSHRSCALMRPLQLWIPKPRDRFKVPSTMSPKTLLPLLLLIDSPLFQNVMLSLHSSMVLLSSKAAMKSCSDWMVVITEISGRSNPNPMLSKRRNWLIRSLSWKISNKPLMKEKVKKLQCTNRDLD